MLVTLLNWSSKRFAFFSWLVFFFTVFSDRTGSRVQDLFSGEEDDFAQAERAIAQDVGQNRDVAEDSSGIAARTPGKPESSV